LSADVLADVTVQDLELAESCDGSRYRFDGPIVLDRGGAFGYNLWVISRNDLLTSVAEPGSWPSTDTPAQISPLLPLIRAQKVSGLARSVRRGGDSWLRERSGRTRRLARGGRISATTCALLGRSSSVLRSPGPVTTRRIR
jgi:hypothetical protein